MFKKTLLPAIIIMAMLTLNTAVIAEPNRSIARKSDVTTFQLTKNLDGTKTFEKYQVVSGTAKNGSEIIMTVFWFKADEDKSIVSRKTIDDSYDNAKGRWIMQGKSSWEVGPSEIFAVPVTLNPGKNRIVITVKEKDGFTKEEVVNVELVYKNELTDFISSIMRNLMK